MLNTTVNTTVVVADVLTLLATATTPFIFGDTEIRDVSDFIPYFGMTTLPVLIDAFTGNWRQLETRGCNVELLPREATGGNPPIFSVVPK